MRYAPPPVAWRVIRAHALTESKALRLFAAQGRCPAYTTPDVEMPANTIPGVGICACGEPFTQAGRTSVAMSCSPECAERRKRAARKAREAHDSDVSAPLAAEPGCTDPYQEGT